jgi:hypothetical protein
MAGLRSAVLVVVALFFILGLSTPLSARRTVLLEQGANVGCG